MVAGPRDDARSHPFPRPRPQGDKQVPETVLCSPPCVLVPTFHLNARPDPQGPGGALVERGPRKRCAGGQWPYLSVPVSKLVLGTWSSANRNISSLTGRHAVRARRRLRCQGLEADRCVCFQRFKPGGHLSPGRSETTRLGELSVRYVRGTNSPRLNRNS